jgi:hypothetical protein
MSKGVSRQSVTGSLRKAELCWIEGSDIHFLFGYVIEHSSPRYEKGDWFATSYIVNIEAFEDHYLFTTANSLYLVESFEMIEIPLIAVNNIRMGTPPKMALRLLKSSC